MTSLISESRPTEGGTPISLSGVFTIGAEEVKVILHSGTPEPTLITPNSADSNAIGFTRPEHQGGLESISLEIGGQSVPVLYWDI